MRKLTAALLVLLFAGMQNLVADGHEGKLTVKVNPYAKGSGKIYLSGDEYRELKNPVATGEAKVNFSADYNGIGGVQVDLKGALDNANNSSFGLGDNAFAYIHILQAFGMDKKIFDVYLKSGRFELGFVKGAKLTRDNKINMQLDMKILDMVTVRTGVAFSPFEKFGELSKDIGFSVHFSKKFADAHTVSAAVGYAVDLTNNQGNDMNGDSKAGSFHNNEVGKRPQGQANKISPGIPSDFDVLGVDLSYEGAFGMMRIKPFFGLEVNGLIAKPRHALISPKIAWNAGLRFTLRDANNDHDMVYTQLEFDGNMRENNNYKEVAKDRERESFANQAFKGFKVTVGSHALKALMGKQYLSFETEARFDFDSPKKKAKGYPNLRERTREGFLTEFKFSATQRLLAVTDGSVNLSLGFGFKNIAPFFEKGKGYLEDNVGGSKQDAAFQSYIELGLDASFTAKVERMVN